LQRKRTIGKVAHAHRDLKTKTGLSGLPFSFPVCLCSSSKKLDEQGCGLVRFSVLPDNTNVKAFFTHLSHISSHISQHLAKFGK
jgi:hypothetical protein